MDSNSSRNHFRHEGPYKLRKESGIPEYCQGLLEINVVSYREIVFFDRHIISYFSGLSLRIVPSILFELCMKLQNSKIDQYRKKRMDGNVKE